MLRRLSGALVLIAILMLGAYQAGKIYYRHAGPLTAPVTIVIAKGSSLSVGTQLEDAGVIKSRYAFALAARLQRPAVLKAGEYLFDSHASLASVINELVAGRVFEHQLTIPEGLSSWQIVQILQVEPALSGPLPTAIPAEGSILPETYKFILNDNRAALLIRIQVAATTALANAWAARDPQSSLTSPLQALTLASIVEKETGIGSERPEVAAVFLNRLRLGMKLQSDPTVLYALDKGQNPLGRTLTHADLSIDSPYNTYVTAGLPPGPICNPGRLALEAVLHPAAVPYLYFVATGKGGHAFAETLADHNRNVAQWLKTLHNPSP